MARLYLFADEAGDFSFHRKGNASKYFIICTVIMPDCSIEAELLHLRRELYWQEKAVNEIFHATEDKQAIRDEVFKIIAKGDITVQATVMEKSKAQPQFRTSEHALYKIGWHFHLRYSKDTYIQRCDEIMLTIASIGVKRKKEAFDAAIRDVSKQHITKQFKNVFMESRSNICLQVADYCTWAIQKKWEREDYRSYDLIKDKITYEYDLWKNGTTHYY